MPARIHLLNKVTDTKTNDMRKVMFLAAVMLLFTCMTWAQAERPCKPRILVSTDIGGTDPDDNQSMTQLLMYSDWFDIEGLVSSPSYGKGSAEEIKRMIDLYGKDYPLLKKHAPKLMKPSKLRRLCKQGRRGLAPYKGYAEPTEGSEWIIKQARKKSDRPLWVLVWGSLEDVAQALHDAPDIKNKIRIYYIGGPNKKWGSNSYAYIAQHFPDVWMIENNATYRGLIADSKRDGKGYGTDFYNRVMKGAGNLGEDFINYYGGNVKMGDTPSLLYMMDGDPENPEKDSWGGSFEKMSYSPRKVFNRELNDKDTVAVYSVMELRFKGPHIDASPDSVVFNVTIDRQQWNGYYTGNGTYAVRYVPKAPAKLTYVTSSVIKELDGLGGEFVVSAEWPGRHGATDYPLGDNWFTDKQDPSLFEGKWHGAKIIRQHRTEILDDWSVRWQWLKQR